MPGAFRGLWLVQPGARRCGALTLATAGSVLGTARTPGRTFTQGGPKGEGGLDDATGASKMAGGAGSKQTSAVVDLSERLGGGEAAAKACVCARARARVCRHSHCCICIAGWLPSSLPPLPAPSSFAAKVQEKDDEEKGLWGIKLPKSWFSFGKE